MDRTDRTWTWQTWLAGGWVGRRRAEEMLPAREEAGQTAFGGICPSLKHSPLTTAMPARLLLLLCCLLLSPSPLLSHVLLPYERRRYLSPRKCRQEKNALSLISVCLHERKGESIFLSLCSHATTLLTTTISKEEETKASM